MIGRLKRRLADWAGRVQQKEIDRLHAEAVRLKTEALERNGGERVDVLTHANSVFPKIKVYDAKGFERRFSFFTLRARPGGA